MKWRIWIHKALYRLGLRKWIMRSEDFEPGTLVYVRDGVAYLCQKNSPMPLGIALNDAPKGGRVSVLLSGVVSGQMPDKPYYIRSDDDPTPNPSP